MDTIKENLEIPTPEEQAKPLENPQPRKSSVRRLMQRFPRIGRVTTALLVTLAGTSGAHHPPSIESADSARVPPAASPMVDRPSTAELLPYLSPEERFFVDSLSEYLDHKVMDKVMTALNPAQNPGKQFITSFGGFLNPEGTATQDGYFLSLLGRGGNGGDDEIYQGPTVISVEFIHQKEGQKTTRNIIRLDIKDQVADFPNQKVEELYSSKRLEQTANKLISSKFKSKWNKVKGKQAIDRKIDSGDKLEIMTFTSVEKDLSFLTIDTISRN